MGNALASYLWISGPCCRTIRAIMLGLGDSGKTTILYRIYLGKLFPTIPTIGFNVETIHKNNLHMTLWDVGGQDKLRCLWNHYYQNTEIIIYVIDAVDKERLGTAIEELHKLLFERDLDGAPILILVNKQDHPHAMPTSLIVEQLNIGKDKETTQKIKSRIMKVQPCSAINGKGLNEGLKWIEKRLYEIRMGHRYTGED